MKTVPVKKLTIANAKSDITSPTTAFVIVDLAFCTWLSLPAEVAYIIPPIIIKITDRAPAKARSVFVTFLIIVPKSAGPGRPAGAVIAERKNDFIMM